MASKPSVPSDDETKLTVLNNLENDSTKKFNLTCPACSINLKTKDERDEHIEHVHNQITCNKCDDLFKKMPELEIHCQEVHAFKCSAPKCYTHYPFISIEVLQKHKENVHTFNCDKCIRTFTTDDSLQLHHSFAHLPVFQCSYCGVKFFSEELVQKHVNAIHISRCHKCARDFTTNVAFKIHNTANHAIESFCHVCGIECDDDAYLVGHLHYSHNIK